MNANQDKMNQSGSVQSKSASDSYNQSKCKKSTSLALWSMAWVVSMALTAFGPRFIWDFNTVLSLVCVLVNLAVGGGLLMAYRRYLQSLDELERKIMLDAMATTLGVGLIVSLSYELLEDIKLISFEPEIPHVVIIMCLTYAGAQVVGKRKYR